MTDSSKDIADKLRADVAADQARDAEELELADQLDPPAAAPVTVDPPAPAPAKPPAPPAPDPGIPSPDPKSPPQDPPAAPPSAPAPDPAPPAAPAPSEPPVASPGPAAPPVPITPSSKVPTLPLDPETYGDFVAMHPGLKPSHISEAVLAALSTTELAGTPGEMVLAEGGTGFRPEIGERAYGSQVWATTMDPRARVHMLAEADLAKESFPIHDTINGLTEPPKPWLWSMDGYTHLYAGQPVVRTPDPLATDGIVLDLAHFPQFVFDPTILMAIEGNTTKFAEYLSEMKWIVSKFFFDRVLQTPQYCQGTKGIFNSLTGQQREQGWGFRGVDDLLFVLEHFVPGDEWIPWLAQCVGENVKFRDGVFRTGTYETQGDLNHSGPWQPGVFVPYGDYATGKFVNPWGITRGADGYSMTKPVIALWQQGFESSVITRSHNRDHPSLSNDVKATHAALVDWLGNLWKLVLGAPNVPAKCDYRRASAYTFETGTFVDRTFDPARPGAKGVNFFTTEAAFFAQWAALPALPNPDDHLLRKHDDVDNTPLELPGDFLDNCIPAIYGAVDAGVDLSAEIGRLESTPQWQRGGDLAFAYLSKGKKYPVDDGAAPVQTPPAPPPAPTQPTSTTGPIGTKIGNDGDNIQSVDGHGEYGVTLTVPTRAIDGRIWPPGDFYVDVVLKAGPLTITPAALGVADPCYGIPKALYLESTSDPVTPVDPVDPVDPVTPVEPVTPVSGVADHGSAGYTTEETADDHLALPGPIVDPTTWAPEPKQGKSLPMRNTLLDSLPAWFKDVANSVINNWPGFAWLKGLQGLWGANGGHQVMETNYAAVLFPKCLMWQARNYAAKAVTETDAIAGLDTGPDDIGPGDLPDMMHGYGGILARDGDLGVGPEAVVYATNYRDASVTNDVHMINPKVLNGGGWAQYARGRGIPIGNYAQAAVSRKRKGFFIGDSRDGRMFFCPFDPTIMWLQVASVIPQWSNGTMIVDDDREIIIGICGAVDPYYDGVSPNHTQKLATGVLVRNLFDDAGAITTLALDVSTNPIVGLSTDGVTPEFEPDRCGLKYAVGCGFFGVKKTNAGGRYVHFGWKDPAAWQSGVTPVSIWDIGVDVPVPSNDVYGALSVEQHFKDIETSVLPADHPIRQRWFALHPVSHLDAPFMSGLDVTE